VRYVSITVLCPQLTEQCLGFLEVGGIQALGEPTVDRREALVSLSALALLLPQASQAPGRAQAVLSLSSDPRGEIVDRDEDALPLPVRVSNAAEAIFDQLPAGRTLGGTRGRERGSHRPCSGRRRLHPPALRADAARQPPATTVGQRVNVQGDRLAEPQRELRVVRHRVLGQRVDEDIEPGAVHHQVGHHLRELVGCENDQHVGARVRPARRVAEGLDLDLALRPERRAHPFGHCTGAGRIVVDVGVIAYCLRQQRREWNS
jgi:hypothetical protein